MTQCNRTTVNVDTAVSDFSQLQVFDAWQRLSSKRFVHFPVIDVSHVQTRTLQGFLGSRNRAVTHDRSIHTSNGHRHDTGAWLQTQFHGFFVAHQQHGGSAVSDLRRRTSRYGTALRIEGRTQGAQAFCGGFRTDGFVLGYQDFFAIFIVTVHRYDFVLELTFQRGFVSQTVRTGTELILLLTGNTVHFAQHFCGQTHHVGGLGRVLGSFRVVIEAVLHVDVAHVLHTTHYEHITVTGHDGLSGSMNSRHRRTTQTVNSQGAGFFRHHSHQTDLTGYVEALLQSLVYTAPDNVFNQRRVHARVTLKQSIDQVGRNCLCPYVAEYATFGTTHR